MQPRSKQKRYWTGKAPSWLEAEGDDAAAPEQPAPGSPALTVAVAAAAPPAALLSQPPLASADPRLLRLTQRQGQSERRGPVEAVVVQRRRAPSPEQAPPSPPRQAVDAAADEDEDEQVIAARRMAIRARQLAAAAAGDNDDEEEASEDSSEYTSEEDSDDGHAAVMLKPAFVPKTERETLADRDAVLAQAEQTTRQMAEQLEDRRRQTQELVAHVQLQEAQQDAPTQDVSDFDTDDEQDEEAQYEAWRERELQRIARDRQLRQAGTKAEAAALAASSTLPTTSQLHPKKKWKFLQKYWHKGAFFQSEGNEGENVLGDIMHRDYDAPTGEDKFDKQMLPKIMQVRNFGRRGRTKWEHLLAEDTTMQAQELLPVAGRPMASNGSNDFSKPRTHKT